MTADGNDPDLNEDVPLLLLQVITLLRIKPRSITDLVHATGESYEAVYGVLSGLLERRQAHVTAPSDGKVGVLYAWGRKPR